jgi:2'-5' RNA ligase
MPPKSGVYMIAELSGPVAERIHNIQRKYDPKLAGISPPHITLVGSSGIGTIPRTTAAKLREVLEPITSTTAPITLRFEQPVRFMQTDIIALPLDPHGPLRVLHERVAKSGLGFGAARHRYSPHCTLSYYPTLTAAAARELLAMRIDDPFVIDRVQLYYTMSPQSKKLLELPLTGKTN